MLAPSWEERGVLSMTIKEIRLQKNLSLSPYSVEKKGRYNYAAKIHDNLIVRSIFYNQHKVSLVRN